MKRTRRITVTLLALLSGLAAEGLVARELAAQALAAQVLTAQALANLAAASQPAFTAQTKANPPAHSSGQQTFELNLVLQLSARRLSVYRGEMLVARYAVAVGREGWQTPTGEFTVTQKQVNPAWEHPFTGEVVPPGPDNPLGSRWIGFWTDGTNAIGFHGTPDESVIGSAVSHGCVRMRDEDIKTLYEQVTTDTRVTVLP